MAAFRLDGARLLIREWRAEDEPGFRAMVSDPVMMRYMGGGVPWPEARIAEFFARQERHLAAHGCCMGALVERSTARLAGVAGIQPMGKTSDFEVGWWVVRELWGHGLATEAGAAALRFGWEVLGLERIAAIAAPDNLASRRVMEKLGLRYQRQATGAELGLTVPDVEVVLYLATRPGTSGAAAETGPEARSTLPDHSHSIVPGGLLVMS
jgi:[ribosomal protein S5]-alanine N-acetyltransferase